ncbi:hypothetical protein ACFLYK_01455 [Candidatus Cloacimonadota bacterium]
MKTLKGLYLEEVEIIMENLQRNSQIKVKKEATSNSAFTVEFEDENLYKKIEDMLYYAQKDSWDKDVHGIKNSVFDDDEDYD